MGDRGKRGKTLKMHEVYKEQRRKTGDFGRWARNRYVRQGTEDGRQGTET
jgi:hypothetical protein